MSDITITESEALIIVGLLVFSAEVHGEMSTEEESLYERLRDRVGDAEA